eukprot:COSAG02_NODE_456_length_21968_cov_13.528145_7_plen_44_part_00
MTEQMCCCCSLQNTIDLQVMLCEISASDEAERAACNPESSDEG